MSIDHHYKACEVLLTVCSACSKDENILFVTDPTSKDVALAMWEAASALPNKTLVMMDERTMHGQEPTFLVGKAMRTADVIFGITKFSLFHSQARRDSVAAGARFVNMVDYNLEMPQAGGLYTDFEKQGEICTAVSKVLVGDDILITTAHGTYFQASIKGRPNVPQYGRSLVPGASTSPPDIECATCVVEGTANGVVFIDGSIPHPRLGLIREAIRLDIQDGRIVKISGGEQARVLEEILVSFNDDNVFLVGEVGIGLNPNCELNGRMLEDEGCAGTVHFGFGSNTGFFGNIQSAYHLDMVFRAPTLSVDGKELLVEGELTKYVLGKR